MKTVQKDQSTKHPLIRKVMTHFITTALTVIVAAGLGILLQPATAYAENGDLGSATVGTSINGFSQTINVGYEWNTSDKNWVEVVGDNNISHADNMQSVGVEANVNHMDSDPNKAIVTMNGTPTKAGTWRLVFINGGVRATWTFTINSAEGGTGGNTAGGNTGASSNTGSSTSTSNKAKTSTSKTATAAVTLTPEQQAQMWVEYQAFLAQMKAAETAGAHQHDYEWVETKHATEDDGGEIVYRCKGCNDVLYRLPLSAYGVFNQNTVNKIIKAGQNATVEISTTRWISFHKSVFEALAARPDVTLKINFLSDGYKGDTMSVTIPAGSDVSSLPDANGYAGFKYLAGIFGTTAQ